MPTTRLDCGYVDLKPTEADALAFVLQEINCVETLTTEAAILEAGKKVAAYLPERLTSVMHHLTSRGTKTAILHFDGLPFKSPDGFEKSDRQSELMLAGVADVLGAPFVAPYHRDGCAFLNLIPMKSDAGKLLSSAGDELGWHTEDAHLAAPSRFLCLLALRGDSHAKTCVSDLDLSGLHPDLTTRLARKVYTIDADESFRRRHSDRTAIVNWSDDGTYHLRYDPPFTDYTDQNARDASDQLSALFEAHHREFTLDTGQLLIFNNRLCAHKRSRFIPSHTTKDRWVQRILVV